MNQKQRMGSLHHRNAVNVRNSKTCGGGGVSGGMNYNPQQQQHRMSMPNSTAAAASVLTTTAATTTTAAITTILRYNNSSSTIAGSACILAGPAHANLHLPAAVPHCVRIIIPCSNLPPQSSNTKPHSQPPYQVLTRVLVY